MTHSNISNNYNLNQEKQIGKNIFKVKDNVFVVDDRQEFIKLIGIGAQGVVISAYDKKTKTKVAIKKIPKAFEDLIDAKRIQREIKILQFFDHENIIRLLDVQKPPARRGQEDIYMIIDLMETDLHRVIYSKQELSDEHIQYFIYQLLKAVHYMHRCKVIHRDLKPSNILLNKKCLLKVCDFGLSRGFNVEPSQAQTEYVVTRWYRAPEVILNAKKQDEQLDVWSVGCILAELLTRTPLLPGTDQLDQVHRIVNLLGSPSEEDMKFIGNESAKRYIKKLPVQSKKDFKKVFSKGSSQCVDLLSKMLVFNPQKRWTIKQCLEHKWLESLYNPSTDLTTGESFDWSLDDFKPELATLQNKFQDEALVYHPDKMTVFKQEKAEPARSNKLDREESENSPDKPDMKFKHEDVPINIRDKENHSHVNHINNVNVVKQNSNIAKSQELLNKQNNNIHAKDQDRSLSQENKMNVKNSQNLNQRNAQLNRASKQLSNSINHAKYRTENVKDANISSKISSINQSINELTRNLKKNDLQPAKSINKARSNKVTTAQPAARKDITSISNINMEINKQIRELSREKDKMRDKSRDNSRERSNNMMRVSSNIFNANAKKGLVDSKINQSAQFKTNLVNQSSQIIRKKATKQ